MKKLTGIELKNFKGIKTMLNFEINGDVFYVAGKNGSGKTSLIEAVYTALTGGCRGLYKKDRWKLIGKSGSSAMVGVTLHDTEEDFDITVKRIITKSRTSVEIKASDGRTIDAGYIESLLSEFTYDLYTFINRPPEEQARLLNIDTSDVDRRIKEAKETLSYCNTAKLRAARKAEDAHISGQPGLKSISTESLLEQLSEINAMDKANAGISASIREITDRTENIKRDIQAQTETIKRLQDALDRKIKESEPIIADNNKTVKKLQAEVVPQEALDGMREDISSQLSRADEVNRKVEENRRAETLLKEADTAKEEWSAAKDALAELNDEKNMVLKNSSLPSDIALITDDGHLHVKSRSGDFVPLDLNFLNTAEAMKIAVELVQFCIKPALPLFFIKGGGLFDRDADGGIPAVEMLKEKTGAQFLCEVVTEKKLDGASSVFLTEGGYNGE